MEIFIHDIMKPLFLFTFGCLYIYGAALLIGKAAEWIKKE